MKKQFFSITFLLAITLFIDQQIFAQSFHLDVEGHSKIRGNLDLGHMDDTTTLHIGSNAGSNTNFSTYRRNTFVGSSSGMSNHTGIHNSFLGYGAGYDNVAGHYNSFFGAGAGGNNTIGNFNSFVGRSAGSRNIVGSRNSFFGYNANQLNYGDTLDRAIAIGYEAKVDCSNCAIIGGTGINAVKVGIGVAKPKHKLDLGPSSGKKLAVYQASTREDFYGFGISNATLEFHAGSVDTAEAQMVLRKTSGNVGIGTVSPARKLHLYADPSTPQIRLQDANSYMEIWGGKNLNILTPDGSTRFKVEQDGKLFARWLRNIGDHKNVQYNFVTGEIGYDNSSRLDKQDIRDLEDDFDVLLEATPKIYTREWAPDRWEIGFIAEDFHDLGLTPLVEYNHEGYPDGIRYDKMVTYIIPLLKQHQNALLAKEKKIEALESEMQEIKKELRIVWQFLHSVQAN